LSRRSKPESDDHSMSDSTKETPESQNPASDAPVAPETTPQTASAEDTTPDVPATADAAAAGTDAAVTEPVDAEPVVATAAATTADESDSATASAPATTSTGRRGRKTEDRPKRGPVRPAGPAPLGHFAVIETGGKQYRVSVGDKIAVERLTGEAGDQVTIDRVLLVGGDGATQVGAPVVEGASVTATIESQYRGEKLVIFKFKPKKRYRRKTGHRQELTRLSITGITA
jgi:large subunit ribosomal protein L21